MGQCAPARADSGTPINEVATENIVIRTVMNAEIIGRCTPFKEVDGAIGRNRGVAIDFFVISADVVPLVLGKVPTPCAAVVGGLQVTLREIHLLRVADTELAIDAICGNSRDALDLVACGCGEGDVLALEDAVEFVFLSTEGVNGHVVEFDSSLRADGVCISRIECSGELRLILYLHLYVARRHRKLGLGLIRVEGHLNGLIGIVNQANGVPLRAGVVSIRIP